MSWGRIMVGLEGCVWGGVGVFEYVEGECGWFLGCEVVFLGEGECGGVLGVRFFG